MKDIDYFYNWVSQHLISQQSPTLGLFPRTLDAYVTDNVYACVSIWALSKAFDRQDDDSGRQIELELCVVKCMRGILTCYTKQLDKLEKFKLTQDPDDTLHAKFNTHTGDPLDRAWYHAQIHPVSLYLFYLAQMIKGGLSLIYTSQEVHIVQNLVYYVKRAYRTRDFGMWGQGQRSDPSKPELSASSIALTKAALEVCDGLNLFGKFGSQETVVFVDPDAAYRNITILDNLLPRESKSKGVDSALLMAIGFPAFAVSDKLCRETEENVNSELLGKYGYKRFLGDRIGVRLKSALKDNQETLKCSVTEFENIECEWPHMLLFQIITSIFNNRPDETVKYHNILKPLLYPHLGFSAIPHYFYFQHEDIPAEISSPGSQSKKCQKVKDKPVLKFQALLILAEMLQNKLVFPDELDFRRIKKQNVNCALVNVPKVVQITLLSESTAFQSLLATSGITTQTPTQIESVYIWPTKKLEAVLHHAGADQSLGLTGRPKRPLGSLATSRVWKVGGKTVMCVPRYQDKTDSYLCRDENYISQSIKEHLLFLKNYWAYKERPTFCLLLSSNLFKKDSKPLMKVLNQLKSGSWNGITVKLGRLQELISVANHAVVNIDYCNIDVDFQEDRILASPVLTRRSLSIVSIPEFCLETEGNNEPCSVIINATQAYEKYRNGNGCDVFKVAHDSRNLTEQMIALICICERHGNHHQVDEHNTAEGLLLKCYTSANVESNWAGLRYCCGFLARSLTSLAPAVSAVIVSGRSVSLGVMGKPETIITEPLHPHILQDIFHSTVRAQSLVHVALQQEVLIYTAEILQQQPDLFDGILIVRIGWIIHTIEEESTERMESMSPSAIKQEYRTVLKKSCGVSSNTGWRMLRELNGKLNKVPLDFYHCVWNVLNHQDFIFSLSRPDHTLSTRIDLCGMRSREPSFAMLVERFLSVIEEPINRHFIIEILQVFSVVITRNPEMKFPEKIDLMTILKLSKQTQYENSESKGNFEDLSFDQARVWIIKIVVMEFVGWM